MATLKEFEDALKSYNMVSALAVLDQLRNRDKAKRTVTKARRITARKMTPELARAVLDLHKSTSMTQQEIAFKLGVNQGRVNEVVKHGKWLSDNPAAPEAIAREKAKQRMREPNKPRKREAPKPEPARTRKPMQPSQLMFGDF